METPRNREPQWSPGDPIPEWTAALSAKLASGMGRREAIAHLLAEQSGLGRTETIAQVLADPSDIGRNCLDVLSLGCIRCDGPQARASQARTCPQASPTERPILLWIKHLRGTHETLGTSSQRRIAITRVAVAYPSLAAEFIEAFYEVHGFPPTDDEPSGGAAA